MKNCEDICLCIKERFKDKGDDQILKMQKILSKKIKKNKLPLIVFRSKSGGAHVFLFVKEEIINAIDFVFSVWGDSKKKIKLGKDFGK